MAMKGEAPERGEEQTRGNRLPLLRRCLPSTPLSQDQRRILERAVTRKKALALRSARALNEKRRAETREKEGPARLSPGKVENQNE